MSPMAWLTLAGIIVVAVLIAVLMRFLGQDKLSAIAKKRRKGSRILAVAEFVEGMQHIPVVLTLTNDRLHYENPDLEAFLELRQIEEVEYDDELATARTPKGGRVLRLRSHGHTFEFVIPTAEAQKWQMILPPHRADEPGEVHVEPMTVAAATP